MGFILDGLESESYDRQYSDRDLLRRIVSYFRPHGRRMAVIAVMITLNSVMGALGPIVIARAIGLPTSLREMGINPARFDRFAEMAANDPGALANPRRLTPGDCRRILEAAW